MSEALKPVYLLLGEDPALRTAKRQFLQKQAMAQGFEERESHHVQNNEDFESFFKSLRQGNLFNAKVLIEYNTPVLKFKEKDADAFESYLKNPSNDKIVLLNAAKVAPQQKRMSWYRLLKKTGAIIDLKLTEKTLDVFDLSRAIKKSLQTQDATPALLILHQLQDKIDPVLILWGICHGLHRLHPLQHLTFNHLLLLAEETDLIIKGLRPGKKRDALEVLVLACCGKDMLQK